MRREERKSQKRGKSLHSGSWRSSFSYSDSAPREDTRLGPWHGDEALELHCQSLGKQMSFRNRKAWRHVVFLSSELMLQEYPERCRYDQLFHDLGRFARHIAGTLKRGWFIMAPAIASIE